VGWTLLAIYGAIALISAVIVYVLSRRAGDTRRPPTHPLILSLVAGAAWPLLLLGLAEFGSFAAYVRMHRSHHGPPASGR
jgi:hypothetical protein